MDKIKKNKLLKKVLIPMAITMLVVNFISVALVGQSIQSNLIELEEKYLDEIISNINSTIHSTMTDYIHTAKVIARVDSVKNIMIESDYDNPMHTHPTASNVANELNYIANEFSGSLLNIGLLDIEQDGYLLYDGSYSDDSFSFKSRPYYSAITTRDVVVTDPYLDVVSNTMVVSACVPVFSNNNDILGAIIIDISTSFVSDLVTNNNYGETSNTIMFDNNDNILAHTNSSLLGNAYSSLNFTGDTLASEKINPTSQIFNFSADGVSKMGAIGKLDDYGWTLLVSIDWSEFFTTIIETRSLLLLVQTLSIIFSLIVCSSVIKKRLDPIQELNIAMSEIVKGDMHYVIDAQSDDEIGELADNLRTTIKNLADYIDEIARILKEFGVGNFQVSQDMDFLGDFAQIQVSMNEFIVLISQTLSSLKGTVKQVSLGSQHVSEGAQNLANGAIEQSANIHELNEVVVDITTKINDNSKNAIEISESATHIQSELSDSNNQMKKMIESMLDINAKSVEIKTITENIEDIAFQTDILALNAAVEASRAGQHGKGFAIVADEVRNLAAKISEEVQRTDELVSASVQAIEGGCNLADSTAKGIEKVTQDVNDFTGKLQLISTASAEQAKSIKEINIGIESISSIMQNNSAISEESAATAEELSAQSIVMNDAINQFKTKE